MRYTNFWQVATTVAGFLLLSSAQAKPAPWYWWVSKVNGERVCAQVMPAQGWTRGTGPFDNAQCSPQRIGPRGR